MANLKIVDFHDLGDTIVYRCEDLEFEYIFVGYDIQYNLHEDIILILPFYEISGCISLVR